jgi:hypothetical protein
MAYQLFSPAQAAQQVPLKLCIGGHRRGFWADAFRQGLNMVLALELVGLF